MGYVIKLTHRDGGKPMYIGAVPVATNHDDDQVRAMEQDGLRVDDYENTPFENCEEASNFPYLTAEVASDVVFSFLKTENIEYEIIPTGNSESES